MLRVHTPEYLQSLRSPAILAGILEVPVVSRLPGWLIDWLILRPMRLATGGTILACRLALEHGPRSTWEEVITMRHRTREAASASMPTTALATTLHEEGRISRVLIVDLDAHQGNGTAAVFHDWPWASILDFYEDDLFPVRKEPEDYPLPAPPDRQGASTWKSSQDLPGAIDEASPTW